jgi:hypothetical protein
VTANLKSQIATSSLRHGGKRKLPYAFTEHGAIMAATVLNSKQAVEMSVFVVRTFVKLRETLAAHKELSTKIDELDRKVGTHDKTITSIIAVIRQLTTRKPPAIGFRAKRETGDDRTKPKDWIHTRQKEIVVKGL